MNPNQQLIKDNFYKEKEKEKEKWYGEMEVFLMGYGKMIKGFKVK